MKVLFAPDVDAVDACARLVMETVPLLMRVIRREMRRQQPGELSWPQFRTLRILRRHPCLSLSQLAARLGPDARVGVEVD